MKSWHGHGADGMTYEEYRNAVYNACKEDAVTEAYPKEFEKLFKELEESGSIRRDYERGVSPYSNVMAICLMV